MSPLLFQAGATLAAMALLIGAIMSFVTGTALGLGTAARETIEPVLARFRAVSPMPRGDLADNSILLAICFAGAGVVESLLSASLIGALLWYSRPMVRRLTSEENPMLALGQRFSTDFVIGLYVPVTMAVFLLGSVLIGLALAMVVVALSWPAGGGTSVDHAGHLRLAWQKS